MPKNFIELNEYNIIRVKKISWRLISIYSFDNKNLITSILCFITAICNAVKLESHDKFHLILKKLILLNEFIQNFIIYNYQKQIEN